MHVFVGTSGFSYKEWKGVFYPESVSDKQMLDYYATQFHTVEINNTFYRMPTPSLLEPWKKKVSEPFLFSIKCPRRITHQMKLKDTKDQIGFLYETVSCLNENLGCILFQLPPYLRKDASLLRDFLIQLPQKPSDLRVAIEFRHASWFTDDVYALLQEFGVALCVADFDEDDKSVPFVSTASWGYFRLRAQDYSDAELGEWSKKILSQPWNQALVFFKHEEQGVAPKLASRLRGILGAENLP